MIWHNGAPGADVVYLCESTVVNKRVNVFVSPKEAQFLLLLQWQDLGMQT